MIIFCVSLNSLIKPFVLDHQIYFKNLQTINNGAADQQSTESYGAANQPDISLPSKPFAHPNLALRECRFAHRRIRNWYVFGCKIKKS